eukprot:COSAG06_NODE_45537_length_354_cov_0.603922_1_plen_45_part_10
MGKDDRDGGERSDDALVLALEPLVQLLLILPPALPSAAPIELAAD